MRRAPPLFLTLMLLHASAPADCASPLDDLLGLTPSMLDELRAELANATLSAEWRRPLRRHSASRSVLQDAFVRLHRYLYSQSLLPLADWGIGRMGTGGMGLGSNANWNGPANWKGMDHSVLDRVGVVTFLKHFAERPADVPLPAPGPASGAAAHNALRASPAAPGVGAVKCIEWDQPHYVHLFRSCTEIWSFRYGQAAAGSVREGTYSYKETPTPTLYGDLTTLVQPDSLGKHQHSFDLIVATQVWEHLPDPFASARALMGFLKPGGTCVWVAPFTARYHLVPGDYFRYTVDGATTLFQRAGFEVVATRKLGDSMITSGYVMGFGAGDFEEAHLRHHMMSKFRGKATADDHTENLYMGVGLVLRKPAAPS